MKTDAESAYDDKSEKWQESDAGQEAKEAIDSLNSLFDSVGELEDNVTEVIGGIESLAPEE